MAELKELFDPSLAGMRREMRVPRRTHVISAVAVPIVLISCTVLPRSVFAQQAERAVSRDSAVIRGVIQDQESGAAVPGAALALVPIGISDGPSTVGAADDSGHFRFAAVAPGTYRVTVNRIGYRMREDTLTVEGGTEVRLILSLAASPVPVDPLRVEVLRRPWLSQDLEAFEARRARLHGTFIDRAEIEKRNPRVITDLFRAVPSTQVVGGVLYSLRTATLSAEGCALSIFVDGVLLSTRTIDTALPPDMVEAIEVYTSIGQVPPQYNIRNPCGVVIIWLRRGSPPVPPRDRRRWWKGVAAVAGVGILLYAISR